MRRLSLALAITASLAPSPPCQADEPQQISSSALLLRLRASKATLETAQQVRYELAGRAITVRLQYFDLLTKRYQKELRNFENQREKLHAGLHKVVPKVQRSLQKKGGTAEIEELREQCLAVSRRKGLTKEHIKTEIDPRMARLRALVLPTPAQVLAFDDKVRDQVAALRRQQDALQSWFDLYVDTRAGLSGEPGAARHLAKHQPPTAPPPRDLIEADLDLLSLMALPMSGRDKKTLEKNDALRANAVPEEFAGTLELNRIRIALGLSTLRIDEKLANAARDHSNDMRTLRFFSHTSPVEGKRSPSDRAARAGTSGGAENIAAGQQTGLGAIEAWWYSPGHHKNMLGNHARTGLGQSESYWTQMFGR